MRGIPLYPFSFPNSIVSRYMQIEPKLTCMTLTHLIVTSDSAVYSWQCVSNFNPAPQSTSSPRGAQIPLSLISSHPRRYSNARRDAPLQFPALLPQLPPHPHLLQEEGDAREIRWHIDSLPQHSSSGLDRLVFNQDSTPDIITAVAASDSMLLVARASGNVIRYR